MTLACAPVAGATQYELAIEYRTAAGAFTPYVTYAAAGPEKTFYPQVRGTTYRWRVHARVEGAWGGWSEWATFAYR